MTTCVLPSEKAAQDWAKAATSFGDNDADASIIELRQALDKLYRTMCPYLLGLMFTGLTHGLPIVFQWFSVIFHGLPMVFPWFSLAIVTYQTVTTRQAGSAGQRSFAQEALCITETLW